MDFDLIVTRKSNPDGAETAYVSSDEISLAKALEMVVFMFSYNARQEVVVTDFFNTDTIAIYCPSLITLRDDEPTNAQDPTPDYVGGFSYRFEQPRTFYHHRALAEMVYAFLLAYPKLASCKVDSQIDRSHLTRA